jgi:hypothetical protein
MAEENSIPDTTEIRLPEGEVEASKQPQIAAPVEQKNIWANYVHGMTHREIIAAVVICALILVILILAVKLMTRARAEKFVYEYEPRDTSLDDRLNLPERMMALGIPVENYEYIENPQLKNTSVDMKPPGGPSDDELFAYLHGMNAPPL